MADSRARHPQHDLELIASFAAGEATGAELERAERQLDACDLCVGVAKELRAITLALQALPAVGEMGALPAAPRDFRLTPEQAARLRPTSPVVRWADRLVGAVAAFGKPLGASLATLGLVGLVVGATTLSSLGSATMSVPMAGNANATGAPAATAGNGAGAIGPATQPETAKSTGGTTANGPTDTQAARQDGGGLPPANDTGTAAPGVNPAVWLVLLSGLALVGGLALVVVAVRRG